MNTIVFDLRHSWRRLVTEPGFAIVTILTLALGMGATTAIFSVISDTLLRPLPYSRPQTIALVTETLPLLTSDEIGVSAAEYQDYAEQNHSFSVLAAYEAAAFNLTGAGQPLRVNAARISASAFPLLGVHPVLGRVFGEEEDTFAGKKVVVISEMLWNREFAKDVEVIGKQVKLDETVYTIVGVMPESFRFPFDAAPIAERAQLWLPVAFAPRRLEDRVKEFGVGVVGRLKPGITIEQATADVQRIADGFMRRYAGQYAGNVRVAPKVYGFASRSMEKVRPLVKLLTVGVACVLLIACANVSNLFLIRAGRRRQEMAIRNAIGASPSRILRQTLTESLLICVLGSGVAVAVAEFLVLALRRFGPQDLPSLREVALHPIALLFTLSLTVIVAIVSGIGPAYRASRVAPHSALKEGAQIGEAGRAQTVQNFIAATEIAVALILLVFGGLLLKSFLHVIQASTGFEPTGVFVVRTLFDDVRYPDSFKRREVEKALLARLRGLPGISSVAVASHLPLIDSRLIGFRVEGGPLGEFHWAEHSLVSPGYFRTMGITLREGRDFGEGDRPDTARAAVVSETMARKYFSLRSAVGERFYWGDALFTVIGVAADVRISALDADPPPIIYNSIFQIGSASGARASFVLRSNGAAMGLFDAVQQQIWSIDKELPVYNAASLPDIISDSLAQRRFTILLLGGFAVLALSMSAVGLFAVIAYFVSQRTREFGIRMALGASKSAIYWLVWKRAAAIALSGSVAGLGISVALSRLLEIYLYQVSRCDLATLLAAPILLIAIALFAALWPAREACAVDPLIALRHS